MKPFFRLIIQCDYDMIITTTIYVEWNLLSRPLEVHVECSQISIIFTYIGAISHEYSMKKWGNHSIPFYCSIVTFPSYPLFHNWSQHFGVTRCDLLTLGALSRKLDFPNEHRSIWCSGTILTHKFDSFQVKIQNRTVQFGLCMCLIISTLLGQQFITRNLEFALFVFFCCSL